MSDKEVVVAGYSGHGFVVAEAALLSGMKLLHYTDQNQARINPFDLNYLGLESDENLIAWAEWYQFILGIGDNNIRRKVAERLTVNGLTISSVLHPSASISYKAIVEAGTLVCRNASINPVAHIGKGCILNTSCVIEHECTLGDFVHIAPGAVLAGNVTVGENSFVGANAVVKQNITIGKNVIIGAGAVVLKDIPDGKIVFGNPVK